MSLFAGKLTTGNLFNGGLFTNQVTTWDLTVVTTGASQDYTVDIYAGSGVNIIIDWGDTNSNTYTTTGQKTHTYSNAGTYTVKIGGSFSSAGNIRLGSNAGNKDRLKSIKPIPPLGGLTNLSKALYQCAGLTGSIPTDLLRYATKITNLSYFMYYCTGLNGSNIPEDLFRYLTSLSVAPGCFDGVIFTTSSYSLFLNATNTYNARTNVQFSGGLSKYNSGAISARNNLTSVKLWTITDGGLE